MIILDIERKISNQQYTFLIVDDSPSFTRILRQLIQSNPCWHVLAEARDGKEAARLVQEYNPDIVLMDIVMPEVNGIQATKQIKQNMPAPRIILFSGYHEEEFRVKGLQAGADRFVWKEQLNPKSLEQLIESMFASGKGSYLFE